MLLATKGEVKPYYSSFKKCEVTGCLVYSQGNTSRPN